MTVGRERTERAIAIRDHVLPAIRAYGRLEMVPARGAAPIATTTWRVGRLMFFMRTPFARLPAARPTNYRETLLLQQAKPVLGYGLDVWWDRVKVMSLQWREGDAAVNATSFHPGSWESTALAIKVGPRGYAETYR